MKIFIGLIVTFSSFAIQASCQCRFQKKDYLVRPNYKHRRKKAVVKCHYNCTNEKGETSKVSYVFKKAFFTEYQSTLGCKGVQYTYDQLLNPKSIVSAFNPMLIIRRIKYRNLIRWAKKNSCPGILSLRTYTGSRGNSN